MTVALCNTLQSISIPSTPATNGESGFESGRFLRFTVFYAALVLNLRSFSNMRFAIFSLTTDNSWRKMLTMTTRIELLPRLWSQRGGRRPTSELAPAAEVLHWAADAHETSSARSERRRAARSAEPSTARTRRRRPSRAVASLRCRSILRFWWGWCRVVRPPRALDADGRSLRRRETATRTGTPGRTVARALCAALCDRLLNTHHAHYQRRIQRNLCYMCDFQSLRFLHKTHVCGSRIRYFINAYLRLRPACEIIYIVSGGALNFTHSLTCCMPKLNIKNGCATIFNI